jgi:hypothetical protein
VFDSRFLLCQVFSENPIKSTLGNYSFLVKEFSSECRKVVRVQFKQPPANWNVNFFKKGLTFALLDPEWKFSYDF